MISIFRRIIEETFSIVTLSTNQITLQTQLQHSHLTKTKQKKQGKQNLQYDSKTELTIYMFQAVRVKNGLK